METQEAGKKREAEESPAKPKKKSKAESSSAKRAPEGSPQKEKKKSKASSSTDIPIAIENPEERPPPEAKRSDGSAEPKGKLMKPVIKHPSAKKTWYRNGERQQDFLGR